MKDQPCFPMNARPIVRDTQPSIRQSLCPRKESFGSLVFIDVAKFRVPIQSIPAPALAYRTLNLLITRLSGQSVKSAIHFKTYFAIMEKFPFVHLFMGFCCSNWLIYRTPSNLRNSLQKAG